MQALFSYFLIRSDFNRRIHIKRVQKRLLDGHFERLRERLAVYLKLSGIPFEQLLGVDSRVGLVIDNDQLSVLDKNAVGDALDDNFSSAAPSLSSG